MAISRSLALVAAAAQLSTMDMGESMERIRHNPKTGRPKQKPRIVKQADRSKKQYKLKGLRP